MQSLQTDIQNTLNGHEAPTKDTLLRQVLGDNLDSITLVDCALNIVAYASRKSLREQGLHLPESLAGQNVLDFVDAEGREQLQASYARIFAGERLQEQYIEEAEGAQVLRVTEYFLTQQDGQTLAAGVRRSYKLNQHVCCGAKNGPAMEPVFAQDPEMQAMLDKRQHQFEKHAQLGKLLAGICHELNTPVGASAAGTENALNYLNELYGMLGKVLSPNQTLSEEEAQLLAICLQKAQQEHEPLDSRSKRKLKRALTAQLEEVDLKEDADFIAERIVSAGMHHLADDLVALLAQPKGAELFSLLEAVGGIRQNIQSAALAAAKASRLVQTVKHYDKPKPSLEDSEPVNLGRSLTEIMTIFHNEIKYGVELNVDYAKASQFFVKGQADQLSHIWAALLENALTAMEKRGQLDVEIEGQEDTVLVTFRDQGPGVDWHLRNTLFEPYTTGSTDASKLGLGLSFARKLAEEMGGSIQLLDTTVGAAFQVSLPISYTVAA